ncbi:MAG: rhomboid family intramembrane serine protease [Pseudomonadota bacterium]
MDAITESPATFALIAINILVSLFAFSNARFMERNTFHVGPILRGGEYSRMFSSGFLHVDGTHLFMNMFVLFVFGPDLEAELGSAGFVFVYVGALLAGSGWALLERRREPNYRAVGASGAVSGILVAVCLYDPFQLLLLFGLIPAPAIVFAIGYIAISAALSGRPNSMIGHEAHLGGALGGLLLTLLSDPTALSTFSQQVAERLGG